MIKILYLVSTLEKVGPTKQLYYIIKYLDKNKFTPFLLTLSPEPENTMWDDFKKLNIKIYSLHKGRMSGFLFGKSEVEKFVVKNSIDIIHSHFIRADEMASKIDIKRLATIRYNPDFIDRTGLGVLLVKYLAYKHYRIMSKFDSVVTCSESLNSYFKEKKALVFNNISNSVDLESVRFLDFEKRKELKEKLLGNSEKTFFVTVDSSILGKNVELVINAFLKVSGENDVLIVAGDSKLADKYCNEQKIVFTGNVDNFFEYLSASDVFISASLSEGMPNAVLEAMAHGLSPILSNIGPHQEVVKGTVFEEYIFDKNDEEELCNSIAKIKEKNISKLRDIAREIIERRFNAENMARRYEGEYLSLL